MGGADGGRVGCRNGKIEMGHERDVDVDMETKRDWTRGTCWGSYGM